MITPDEIGEHEQAILPIKMAVYSMMQDGCATEIIIIGLFSCLLSAGALVEFPESNMNLMLESARNQYPMLLEKSKALRKERGE